MSTDAGVVEGLLVRRFQTHATRLLQARLQDTVAFVDTEGGDVDKVLRLWAQALVVVVPRLAPTVFQDVASALLQELPTMHDMLQRVFLQHAQALYAQDFRGNIVNDLSVMPVTVADAFRAFMLKLATQPEVRNATALRSSGVMDRLALNVFRDILAEATAGRVKVLPRAAPPAAAAAAAAAGGRQASGPKPGSVSMVAPGRQSSFPAAAVQDIPTSTLVSDALTRARRARGQSASAVATTGGGASAASAGVRSSQVSAAHGRVSLLPSLTAPSPAPDVPPPGTADSPEEEPRQAPAVSASYVPTVVPSGDGSDATGGAGAGAGDGTGLLTNHASSSALASVITAVTAMSTAAGSHRSTGGSSQGTSASKATRVSNVSSNVTRATGSFASTLGKTTAPGASQLLMQQLAEVRPEPSAGHVLPSDSASQVVSLGIRHRQELQQVDAHRRHLDATGDEVRVMHVPAPATAAVVALPRVAVPSTVTEVSEEAGSSDSDG